MEINKIIQNDNFEKFTEIIDTNYINNICKLVIKEKIELKNRLNMLNYAYKKYGWDSDKMCEYCAENNQKECLEYVHKNNCKLTKMTVYRAIDNSNIEILDYCFYNNKDLIFDIDEIRNYAIQNNPNKSILNFLEFVEFDISTFQK
jgi:hypothetical protein